jgi:C4-dicarboxylate-specific signal transduction histidine kinase
MKKIRFVSLRTKLLTSMGLLVLFLGIIVSVTTFSETQQTLIDIKKSELLLATVNESSITDDIFLTSVGIAEQIASSSATLDILEKPQTQASSRDTVREFLGHFNIRQLFSSIYIIDATGNTIVSTDTTFEGKNYGFRQYFQTAMNGKNGTDMVVGVTSNKPGFYFSTPVKDISGSITGVVVVKLDVRVITNQFLNKTTDFVNYMLVASDGMVLTSNEQDRIFKHLGDPSITPQQIESLKTHYGIQEVLQLDYPEPYEAIKNKDRSKQIDLFDTLENEHEILSVAQIGDTPYYYVTEHYETLISNRAIKPAILIASIQICGTFIAIIIMYFLITKFLYPLTKLQSIAENISNEKFDQTLPFTTNDETNQLGNALVSMSSKLKKSYDTLNENVASKTVELQHKMEDLEKANSQMVGRELRMIELKKQIEELEKKLGENKNTT